MHTLWIAVLALWALPAHAKDPPCPPPSKYALPDAPASEYKFTIEDTAGFNIVARPIGLTITLSEGRCPPVWPSEDLTVSVVYPADREEAKRRIKSLRDGGEPEKPTLADKLFGFSDWRVVSKEPVKSGLLDGMEVLGLAERSTATYFFYTSHLLFGDGAALVVSARGLESQRASAMPRIRRVVQSIRRLDKTPPPDEEETLKEAVGTTLVRLRAPLIDQALDACLAGENAAAVVERARAVGWPQFKNTLIEGATWRTAAMPADDSGKISLGVTETSLGQGRTVVTCTIGAASVFEPAFRDRMKARFGDSDGRKEFSVSGGKVTAGEPTPGEVRRRGVARLELSEGNVTLSVGVARI